MTLFGLPADALVNLVSGVALAALGAYVVRVRPRARANLGFCLLAVGFGLGATLGNLAQLEPGPAGPLIVAVGIVTAVLGLAGLGGLILLVTSFPSPVARDDRLHLLIAAGLFLLSGGALVAWQIREYVVHGISDPGQPFIWLASHLLSTGFWVAAVLLALRFHRLSREEATGAGLLSAALLLWPGSAALYAGFPALAQGQPLDDLRAVLALVFTAILSALWLRNTRIAGRGRLARNVAIFCWVPPLLGVTFYAAGPFAPSGVMRILMILFIAYAILRHQLLDIDVKVRWTINKGTLAGIFVATFFVVSELAKLLFEGLVDNTLVGILAAAVLLFAIAPLQRMTDRIAERAVPATKDDEELFRAALRRFLRSGSESREDEHHLVRLAVRLGIDPERALVLRHDVQDETLRGRSDR